VCTISVGSAVPSIRKSLCLSMNHQKY